MGRRTNPLSLRVGGLLNWPTNTPSPFLSSYIKHIFQDYFIAEPGIRSSTKGIWVNVTLFGNKEKVQNHPKVLSPTLNFQNAQLQEALGRLETRVNNLTQGHYYFKNIFDSVDAKSLVEARQKEFGNLGALGIFNDNQPIHLKVNVISNPLLNAQILADYTAKSMKDGKSLPFIYKEVLNKMA
jgi:hypothetical protein